MKTTLNKIRLQSPSCGGLEMLLLSLGKTQPDDETLWIDQVLDHNGLNDALWCLRSVECFDREISLYAAWCARRVQHLMTDPRSIAALDVVERYARNEASDVGLEAARGLAASASASASAAAAGAAAWDAAAAYAAAAAAAAAAAWAVALASASASASALASASASASAWAAYTAAEWTTDAAAAWSARDTERAAQAEELRRICREMREAGR
jgi:hypothetical protein